VHNDDFRTAGPDDPVTTNVPMSLAVAEKNELQVQKFMATMRRRFRLCADAENESRMHQADDRAFRASRQWDEETLQERARDNRPCMTINRIPQFLSQVTNQARASKPSITVVPLGGGARVDTANYLQGLIRDIELKSDADISYMTAADSQAEIGLGYIKIDTELVDSDDGSPSFDSEPRIRRIRNRFSIYMDPSVQEFDASDSKFCFQVEDLTPDEFDSRYGEKTPRASLEEFATIGDDRLLWLPGGSVRVAHYWYVEEVPETILSLRFPDGTKAILKEGAIDLKLAGATVEGSRVKLKRVVRSCVVNGVGILEGADDTGRQGAIWPSKYIPIVPVIGNEVLLDGKIDYRGMVRDAKEPQRAYNYWVTATVEAVALAPKAPWILADGQNENYEEQWDQANVKNFSALYYTPVSVNGQLAPPPQRNAVEPPIMAMSSLIRQADNDLKATMGFYDASLGQTGPEQSGKAILARQKQGEIGNSQYLDNLSRAIRQVGRICLDLIGNLYDTERIVRIIGDNGKPAMVKHDPNGPPQPETQQVPEGIQAIVNLTAGRYDVTISVGPSFLSRRQEAVAQMGELMGQNPNLAQVIADLWISNMDAPWAAEAAARLRRMVPPQILGEDGAAQLPPEAAAKIQEMTMQLQQAAQMVQMLQQKMAVNEQKLASKELEAQARIEAERIQSETQERITRMELDARATLARVEAEIKLAIAEMKIQADAKRDMAKVAMERERESIRQQTDAEQAERDREESRLNTERDREEARYHAERTHQEARLAAANKPDKATKPVRKRP
jgi:hypothetical protein